MQPFPFDDFTISNFHMQSEEEITIVRRTMSRQADNKQEESLQQNLTLTETLPKNKSVLTGFQFSPEEICNSYDWSLSTIDRESMSLIERSYTNYSTLEINKEVFLSLLQIIIFFICFLCYLSPIKIHIFFSFFDIIF